MVAIAAFNQNVVLADGAPMVLSPPQEASAYSGQSEYFSLQVAGLPPVNCQWRFNGTAILGATNLWLELRDLRLGDAGVYTLVASNLYGSAERTIRLQVNDSQPVITEQPASQVVGERWDPRLYVGATGSQPMSYQWRYNGTNIPGAVSAFLILSNVQPAQSGFYDAVISNQFGVRVSSNAVLQVLSSSVVAWGNKDSGITYVPPRLTNVLAIAAGDSHALALRSDGTVVAWGRNTSSNYGQTNVPPGLSNVVAIAAGSTHSLALKGDGTVTAWGGESGWLTTPPPDLTNVVAVAASYNRNLALRADGTVATWGAEPGQTNVPSGLSNVVAIAAGWWINAALKSDGTVVLWSGSGPNPSVTSNTLSNIVAIAGAYSQILALKRDGTLAVWGSTYYYPLQVPEGLSNVVAIAAGGSYWGNHALALQSDGTLVAWGRNDYRQTNVPATLTKVAAIAAGAGLSMALKGDGSPAMSRGIRVNYERASTGFTVSLPTQNNRVYALDYTLSLSDSYWVPLPLAAGLGRMQILMDTTATNSARFYRVRQW